jgi:hypothetical protein
LNRRLSGPLNQSGRYGEFKILDPTGTEIWHLSRPDRSQSLCQLRSRFSSSEFLTVFNAVNLKRGTYVVGFDIKEKLVTKLVTKA